MAREVENVLTTAGRILLATALGKESSIIFTEARLGTGTAPDSADLAEYTALLKPLAGRVAGIAKKTVNSNGTMTVSVQYLNSDLIESTYIGEIGVYARRSDQGDSEAILFSYMTLGENRDLIMGRSVATVQRVYDIPFVFSGAAEVTLTIAPSTLISNADALSSLDDLPEGDTYEGKLLRLNKDGKLEVDILGDSQTLQGHGAEFFATADHVHDVATEEKNGFMSAKDKAEHDVLQQRVDQDLRTTASPTFKNLILDGFIDGARFR